MYFRIFNVSQKKNLTRQVFFGSVAFGQTNYIFILASLFNLSFHNIPKKLKLIYKLHSMSHNHTMLRNIKHNITSNWLFYRQLQRYFLIIQYHLTDMFLVRYVTKHTHSNIFTFIISRLKNPRIINIFIFYDFRWQLLSDGGDIARKLK
jgi:hypothetical protein